jgi:hypothetical protein
MAFDKIVGEATAKITVCLLPGNPSPTDSPLQIIAAS